MQYVTDVANKLTNSTSKFGNCLWNTGELILDILLEFVTRSIELAISILALGIQILCIFRDLFLQALRVFANAIGGTVNVVGSIDSEDIEDFASACIVIVLWIFAAKFILEFIEKNKVRYNPMTLFTHFMEMYNEKLKEFPPITPEKTWPTDQNSPRKKISNSRGRRKSKKR